MRLYAMTRLLVSLLASLSFVKAFNLQKLIFDATHILKNECYKDLVWNNRLGKCVPGDCAALTRGMKPYFNKEACECITEAQRIEMFVHGRARVIETQHYEIMGGSDVERCVNGDWNEHGYCICHEGWTHDPFQDAFDMYYCTLRIKDSEGGRDPDGDKHSYEKRSWFDNLTEVQRYILYAGITGGAVILLIILGVVGYLYVRNRRRRNNGGSSSHLGETSLISPKRKPRSSRKDNIEEVEDDYEVARKTFAREKYARVNPKAYQSGREAGLKFTAQEDYTYYPQSIAAPSSAVARYPVAGAFSATFQPKALHDTGFRLPLQGFDPILNPQTFNSRPKFNPNPSNARPYKLQQPYEDFSLMIHNASQFSGQPNPAPVSRPANLALPAPPRSRPPPIPVPLSVPAPVSALVPARMPIVDNSYFTNLLQKNKTQYDREKTLMHLYQNGVDEAGEVIQAYTKRHEGELTLSHGDFVLYIERDLTQPGYSHGVSYITAQAGLFPTSFVKHVQTYETEYDEDAYGDDLAIYENI